MKKRITSVFALICALALVGCGAKEQTTADTPNATIPSIMYEGDLYTTTGKQIPAEVDESAIAGHLSSVVPLSQFPSNEGEANFGQIGDPYALTADGLLVLVNHEWTLFEPLEEKADQEAEPQKEVPTCVAPPEPTDAALLSHPPQLRVACGGEEVCTPNGGFSWVTENGILCADALHPLQLREYVTDYVCAQTVQDWAVLQFTDVEGGFLVSPEQVTARAWEEDCTPTCDCLSTDVSVENLSMQLLPGGYVYEVIARWGDGETSGGVTTHMFWVNKLYPGNE